MSIDFLSRVNALIIEQNWKIKVYVVSRVLIEVCALPVSEVLAWFTTNTASNCYSFNTGIKLPFFVRNNYSIDQLNLVLVITVYVITHTYRELLWSTERLSWVWTLYLWRSPIHRNSVGKRTLRLRSLIWTSSIYLSSEDYQHLCSTRSCSVNIIIVQSGFNNVGFRTLLTSFVASLCIIIDRSHLVFTSHSCFTPLLWTTSRNRGIIEWDYFDCGPGCSSERVCIANCILIVESSSVLGILSSFI